jgi:hypothetical protein
MNRYSKIEYPNESSGGGGSNFSLPSFTNALGQTMSNMKSMQDFNEKMIDRQVQGLEEAGKLQTGLFSAIGGLNTYLSQYAGDKEHVDNVVKQYYTQLEEISKNPNDPYIKLKISDLGRKITADMTMGDLSKVISNAKIHAERTKDLEQNKDVLKIDSGAGADYDIINKDFKGTFSRDKDGKVNVHSLKYANISPALDIDGELDRYMKNVEKSTIGEDKITYAMLPENLAVISMTTTKGVGETIAFKNAKDFLVSRSNNPNDEYKRRLVRDFNLKANGKDYIETKDPDGNKIRLSLEEYIDLENNKLAKLKSGKYVNSETNTTRSIVDQQKRAQELKESQSKLWMDKLQGSAIQHGMADKDRDYALKLAKFKHDTALDQAKFDLEVEKANGSKTKLEQAGIGMLNPATGAKTMLKDNEITLTKEGVSVLTDDALNELSNNLNTARGRVYNKVADDYDKFINENKKDIRTYAPNYEKLRIGDPNLKSVIAATYAELMSDREFRLANTAGKASILEDKLSKKTKGGKPLNLPKRTIPINNKDIVGYTSHPLEGVINQLEKEPIYQINGKAVTGAELYKGKIAESMNYGEHIPAYYYSGENKDMERVFDKVAQSAINNKTLKEGDRPVNIGKEFNMSQKEFSELFKDKNTTFTPNIDDNSLEVTMTIPIKRGSETEYKEKTFTITDPALVRDFAFIMGKRAYEATSDPSNLKQNVDIMMSGEDKKAKINLINNNYPFTKKIGKSELKITSTTPEGFGDKEQLNEIRDKFNKQKANLKLDDKFLLVYINGEVVGAYDYKTNIEKEARFNETYYNLIK